MSEQTRAPNSYAIQLAPLLLLLFFFIIKFSDDILQHDLSILEQWSDKWLLKFHPDKCKHMEI